MARCHGEHCPYGYGHHEEHVRAARLGWMRRRSGRDFEGSDQQRWLGFFAGGAVSNAHTHRTKRGTVVMFKHKGKWFEVSRSAFRGMVAAGRDMERDELREQKRAEAERKRLEREHASAARKAEADRKREAREREIFERNFRRMQQQERADVVKELRRIGGVKYRGKVDHGEWQLLPSSVRNQKTGKPMDIAREHINEHFPWLNLDTPDDLVRFFETQERFKRATQRRKAA